MPSAKTKVANEADRGIIQSFKLKVVSSNIFWKKGIYITPNDKRSVNIIPIIINLLVKNPILRMDSSKDLKTSGTNNIILIIVANVNVLA